MQPKFNLDLLILQCLVQSTLLLYVDLPLLRGLLCCLKELLLNGLFDLRSFSNMVAMLTLDL